MRVIGKKTETQRKDKIENTEDKPEDSSSDDEENYELDETGCPDLSKSYFACEDCGGRDEHWKCKGVSGIGLTEDSLWYMATVLTGIRAPRTTTDGRAATVESLIGRQIQTPQVW